MVSVVTNSPNEMSFSKMEFSISTSIIHSFTLPDIGFGTTNCNSNGASFNNFTFLTSDTTEKWTYNEWFPFKTKHETRNTTQRKSALFSEIPWNKCITRIVAPYRTFSVLSVKLPYFVHLLYHLYSSINFGCFSLPEQEPCESSIVPKRMLHNKRQLNEFRSIFREDRQMMRRGEIKRERKKRQKLYCYIKCELYS